MTILVGGVGQLYQGDFDFGRVAVERLAREELGAAVVVEDLSYGAVAVAQRLQDLRPEALVLVGAVERPGRPPGSVERRRVRELALPPSELQIAVGDAVTGYVGLDLVVEVGTALGALPARTVAIEVEPALAGPSERLSAEAEHALEQALGLVREEVLRASFHEAAGRVRGRSEGDDHGW